MEIVGALFVLGLFSFIGYMLYKRKVSRPKDKGDVSTKPIPLPNKFKR